MIGRVRLFLHFPGDEDPIDVSQLVIWKSVSFDPQFCSDEYRSAVDTFSFSLKHDSAIVTKLCDAHARILVSAHDDLSGDPLFKGAIEPTAAQSVGQFVGNIELQAVDNSWKLDEPIASSFTAPQVIGLPGFYLYNSSDPLHSLVHAFLLAAGYGAGEIAAGVFPEIIPHLSVTAGEETYRQLLDDLLSEYGYVLHPDEKGIFSIKRWRHEGESADEELGSEDLSVVVPLAWNKSAEYRDGAKVVWSEGEIVEGALVYRDSLPLSSDGIFEGKAIASGDYYPSDSDIEDIYQDFVESWLDTPYLTRSTRIKNKDLSLIATSGHEVLFAADAGVVLEHQEFEGLRARVRFRNTGGATAKIYYFEIRAKALVRLALRNVVAPEGAGNPRKYTSRFLMTREPAVNLAKALAIGVAFADFKYTFGLNRPVSLGKVVRLLEPRINLDTLALVQRCVLTQGNPVAQVTAIAVTDPAGLTYREWASQVTSGWLAAQAAKDQYDNVIGGNGEGPADVTALAAVAGKESIVVSWVAVAGTTVKTAATGYILQRSTDGGATWHDTEGVLEGNTRATSIPYAWAFDRSTDGYPEALSVSSYGYPALDAYRFRIKAVNSSGTASLNWTTLELVDASQYGTWLPSSPSGGTGSSSGREAKVDWNDSAVYGLLRYEVQIALESADPSWYEPALGLDIYASEDTWRQSIVVGRKRATTISQFTHAVPLSGQNDTIPNPTDTAYLYRVRTVSSRAWTSGEPALYSETEDGRTAGPWSVPIPVLARATGAYDIVQRAIGQAQIAFGAIRSEHMSAQNLAAVFAYIAALSGGEEDEYNTWILNDYPGRTKAIGYFRVGGANVGIEYNPTTGKFRIIGVNVELSDSDLTTYEPGVEDPRRQTIESLGLVIKDSDENGNAELARLGFENVSGLWGGEKLGGLVYHGAGTANPYLEKVGGGIIRIEMDDYGPKYTLFDGTFLRPSPITYVQLPGMPLPSDAYGGTWEDISSSYPGDFFRVVGGNALAFGAGRQGSANLAHAHGGATGVDSPDHAHYQSMNAALTNITGGGLANYPANGSSFPGYATSGATARHAHGIASDGSGEARPQNQSVRVWRRRG